ncbi:MAG: hypothetical protein Q9159_002076 [Coniocarpon cinnabarinum]
MPPKGRKPAPKATGNSRPKQENALDTQRNAKPLTRTAQNPAKTNQSLPKPQNSSATDDHRPRKRRHIESGQDDAFDTLLEPFYYGKHLSDPINTARDKWNLLPAFLKVKGLVKQHIDSYNYFIDVELQNIMRANQWIRSDVNDKFWFKYTNIRVGRPSRYAEQENHGGSSSGITPNECRLRDMTYAAPVYVDYMYHRAHATVTRKNVPIGRMPMMLRSNRCVLNGKSERQMADMRECAVDPGGYFIVKGQEKVILVQEQLSKNRVIVEAQKDIVQASVTSSTHERKSKSYVLHMKDQNLYLRHNVLTESIPVVITLKALGVANDKEILELTTGKDRLYQDLFMPSLERAIQEGIFTQQQALEYIGQRVKLRRPFGTGPRIRNYQQEALEALASIILTHVPVEDLNFRHKALYVAFMVRRVLAAMHDPRLVDDRDYVGNKRLELAGQMLSLLFEDHFKRFNHELKIRFDYYMRHKQTVQPFDAHDHFRMFTDLITMGMERAIATGNWNLKRFKMERAGVTHVLSRLSYISALGMMTRITSQFEKTRKVSGPRALQSSQFGTLCPSDTPEGEACGLVKNLALMTHITTEDKEDAVRELVFFLGAEDITQCSGEQIYSDHAYIIFINGTPVALTREPETFLITFRSFRRMGRVSEFVSIHINNHHNAVHIATDEGRICRPLIVVERGRSKVKKRDLESLRKGRMGFDDFLTRGYVEYLDVNEENDSNIAVYEADITDTTTHLEIEPFTILGAVAGLIPYPHHNQSPRNTYQCAMGKQAIGAIAYNQFTRIDTLLYLMTYPQKPLVRTRAIELVQYDKLPAGQNAMVAVMSYSGYDIEDALVLNKASLDRGFGRCQVLRKNATHMKRYANGNFDDFGAADPKKTSHRNVGVEGIIEVGSQMKKDDVYLVKNIPNNTSTNPLDPNQPTVNPSKQNRDYHTVDMGYKLPDPCYISQVMLSTTENESTLLKIQTRQTRRPEVGDKFSSRHGQKGVVGLIAEQTDLPFTDEGIVPDVIMNPHGFPSRMTVGKMLELVAGKAGILKGQPEYGTAFGGSKVEDMGAELVRRGFNYGGKDYMTCGITGEPMPAYVFFGPIYYQKLKHMVQDKLHSRSLGPKTTLTRQPTEGRSRGGGLRLGEMERDCLIAYGASQLLLERLMISSDRHDCEICETCGGMGYLGWCGVCKSGAGVRRMTIPYAAKLLVQELASMGVGVKFKLEDAFRGDE